MCNKAQFRPELCSFIDGLKINFEFIEYLLLLVFNINKLSIMAILGCLFVFILCCVGSNVFADYWIGKKTNLTDEKPKEEVSQLDEQLKEISEPIKTTKKHFESRIIEVSFKDKESEYFPQIKKENSSGRIDCFSPKDGWYYVGKEGFMDRLEARENDYKCACSTIKEAIEKINKGNDC